MRRTCAWYDRESQLGAAVCYITWLYVVGAIRMYLWGFLHTYLAALSVIPLKTKAFLTFHPHTG